jgi:hypothetical protein
VSARREKATHGSAGVRRRADTRTVFHVPTRGRAKGLSDGNASPAPSGSDPVKVRQKASEAVGPLSTEWAVGPSALSARTMRFERHRN